MRRPAGSALLRPALRALVAVDDVVHLQRQPEDAGHAGRGDGGPEADHLGIAGGHVLLEDGVQQNEAGNDEHRIENQVGAGQGFVVRGCVGICGFGHEVREKDLPGLVHVFSERVAGRTGRRASALVGRGTALQARFMADTPSPRGVAEVQGLYGPFTFSEMLLQRIWADGDYEAGALVTKDGRLVEVLHPGRWNALGGPDFTGARLRFDGGWEETGDVELHLRAEEWEAHGHGRDPAYAGVRLHVVLFPTEARDTRLADGRRVPVLVLLPWLRHDLEEYAEEAVVERMAGRTQARASRERALAMPREALAEELRRHTERRWAQKRHFARRRIVMLGWEAACHQTALEILGYRFNRPAMLRVAARHPLEEWQVAGPDVAARFAAEEQWVRQGVRPANQPARRLQQYSQWVRARPDWPRRLRELGAKLAPLSAGATTACARKLHGFSAVRKTFAEQITGGSVTGARIDSLICDGFLPLLAADSGAEFFGWWQHWYPGDAPAGWRRDLKACGMIRPGSPLSHGLLQGWLGWLLAQDADAAAGA